MNRIECVAGILKRLGMIPLSAAIEPDWDQSKERKALTSKKISTAEQVDLIPKSAQHLHIDIPEADELRDTTQPISLPEEIENENC